MLFEQRQKLAETIDHVWLQTKAEVPSRLHKNLARKFWNAFREAGVYEKIDADHLSALVLVKDAGVAFIRGS